VITELGLGIGRGRAAMETESIVLVLEGNRFHWMKGPHGLNRSLSRNGSV